MQRIRQARRASTLRRLARHLPDGARVTEDGSIQISSDLGVREFHDRLERSYRFWRVRRRWRTVIRPIRPSTMRGHYRTARSLLDRARYGVGRHDTWDLQYYLCKIAARGLRMLAARVDAIPADVDGEDWLDVLDERAAALEEWVRQGHRDESGESQKADGWSSRVVGLRDAQGALRWIGHNLETLRAPALGDTDSLRADVIAAIERARYGIAQRDTADLGRYLSIVAARGMATIADHGFGYPVSRIDGHDWHAELHRAADGLTHWANPTRLASDNDRRRNAAQARQSWRWIADNLNDLWD